MISTFTRAGTLPGLLLVVLSQEGELLRDRVPKLPETLTAFVGGTGLLSGAGFIVYAIRANPDCLPALREHRAAMLLGGLAVLHVARVRIAGRFGTRRMRLRAR